MIVRAVVFDIGGVLENTPDLGTSQAWEAKLGLPPGELDQRMMDVWQAGAIGAITLPDVHTVLRERLGLDEQRLAAFMGDLWREYVGTANTELIEYVRGLRPRYRTGILSNSFVGAREREQAAYGFEDLVDDIVYSHETGIEKPDPRAYAIACERLAVRPEETIFVDDVSRNVTAAAGAGLHAIHHQDNARTIAGLEKLRYRGFSPGS
jgi:putative hydrolase of the HAD superfamily